MPNSACFNFQFFKSYKIYKEISFHNHNTNLVPVLDTAGGLKAISDNCSCALFKLSWVVLTSVVSVKSFKDFFSSIGSSMLRQPIHLQFAEHGIFAWKEGKNTMFSYIYLTNKYITIPKTIKNIVINIFIK